MEDPSVPQHIVTIKVYPLDQPCAFRAELEMETPSQECRIVHAYISEHNNSIWYMEEDGKCVKEPLTIIIEDEDSNPINGKLYFF